METNILSHVKYISFGAAAVLEPVRLYFGGSCWHAGSYMDCYKHILQVLRVRLEIRGSLSVMVHDVHFVTDRKNYLRV